MHHKDIDISVVIPVYRSRDCLPELLKELTRIFDEDGMAAEVILVDDASPDNTWAVIQKLAEQYRGLVGIRLMRNVGQARATLCGLGHARGSIIVTTDDDLQHPPSQIRILLNALRSHPEMDCVFGSFGEKKHAEYRNWGSRLVRWINARSFDMPKDICPSSFRAMRRRLVQAILSHRTANPSLTALIYGSSRHVMSVPVEHAPRYAGRSGYSLAKQFHLAFDNICNVSMLPLRAITVLGLMMCLLSLVWIVTILYRYFRHEITVPGWTTLTVVIAFSAGLILLSLGVISEYIVRILREVRGAPRHIIRETVGFGDGPASAAPAPGP